MLSTKVKTAQQLMSIALPAERETTRRYGRLAADMREAGNLSAAALFGRRIYRDTHSSIDIDLLSTPERTSVSDTVNA